MNKIIEIFLLFAFVFSEAYGGCRYCNFENSNQKPLEDAFFNCIWDLPKPIDFLGPCYRITRDSDDRSEKRFAEEVLDYYFLEHFKNYSVAGITWLFAELRNDVNHEYQRLINEQKNFISDILSGKKHCYNRNRHGEQCTPVAHKKIEQIQQAKIEASPIIEETENCFLNILAEDIAHCIEDRYKQGLSYSGHTVPNTQLFYDNGFLSFRLGNFEEALDNIDAYLNFLKKESKKYETPQEFYVFQGKVLSQVLSYNEAIQSLNQAIHLNPKNKEAYFERAVAYFELGDFDLSLQEYLTSGMKPKPLSPDAVEKLAFSWELGLQKL